MKRFAWLGLLALLLPTPAPATDVSSIPSKFAIPWGNSAGTAYIRSIPQASQIGTTNCAASLTDGFPPLTFVPASAGGCPPFGQDFNGILKQVTQWAQWQAMGGPVFYDSGFASSIGGYPKGTILSSTIVPGYQWLSTADNNATDPDAGGSGWVQSPGQVPTGTPMQSLTTTVPTGYVSANGRTIGNASSNATNRANADTQFLFAFVWGSCTNAICPIYTSGGIASTRGATAALDYAANKALAVPNMNGSGIMGADSQNGTTSTNLSSVPVVSGSRTAPNSILGENLHTMTLAEIAAHYHAIGWSDPGHTHQTTTAAVFGLGFSGSITWAPGGSAQVDLRSLVTGSAGTGITFTGGGGSNTTGSTGSTTPFGIVQRSTIVYWNLKQ